MIAVRKYWLIGGCFGLLLSVFLMTQLRSQKAETEVAEGNPRELYRVVSAQITAFQQHDYPAAYAFAARGIRDKFPIEQFSDMVRSSYPVLLESVRLSFATTRFVSAERASLLIYIKSGDRLIPAIYAFVREPDGWKIEGVEFVRSVSPGSGAPDTQT